jgi:hypothetical protein
MCGPVDVGTVSASGSDAVGSGTGTATEGTGMTTYRMVYGDEEQVVRETFSDVQLEREDGWTVLFRGKDAILRVRDEHVRELELVDPPLDDGAPH